MHDALCVLTQTVKETRTVPGGGCTEIAMAAAIDAEVGRAGDVSTDRTWGGVLYFGRGLLFLSG